jgi:4-amino-4-deoxy-L-arabinose transferase-like glycosyltransferase
MGSMTKPPFIRVRPVLGLVLVVAALTRFYRLGASSLWIDEAASVALVRMPWARFAHTLWTYEANMTLYYLLLRPWTALGTSELVLRSLSAILGVAGVAALYCLGRRLRGAGTGLLAAALFSVHVLHVWGSQEARTYSLVALLVIVSTHLFVNAVKTPHERRLWTAYVVVSVLAVYAHLFAVLVLGAQWLALGRSRARAIGIRRILGVGLALGVALLPLGLFVLLHDHGQLDWIRYFFNPGFVAFSLLMLTGLNPLLVILVLIGLVRAMLTAGRDDDEAWAARLLVSWLVFPIVLVILVSLVKPVFFFRYFGICVPPLLLLAAGELTRPLPASKTRRVLRWVVAGLTITLSSVVTFGFLEKGLKDWAGDWRGATEHILANAQEGDALVFDVTGGFDAFRYYEDRVPSSNRPVPVTTFPRADELASAHIAATPERLHDAARGHSRVWVVQNCQPPGARPLRADDLGAFRQASDQTFGGTQPNTQVRVSLFEAIAQP